MQKRGVGRGYLALSLTSTLWGTTWVASKIGIGEMPALQMASIRQMIAGLCFVIFFMVIKKLPLPTGKQWVWLFVMAVLMFVMANGLSTWSLQFIPTGLSALVGALYPLSVVVIERIFFGAKKITPLTLLGFVLGIAGIGIVFYENAFSNVKATFLIGISLSLVAMFSWSLGTVFIARNKANLNPYYSVGWQMIISSVLLFFLSKNLQQPIPIAAISGKGWLVIMYLVIFGSIITFVSFIYSMKTLPTAIASLYAYFNPLIAIVTAGLLLGEKLTVNILWGALVTMLGVYLVNYASRKAVVLEPEQM